MRLERIEEGLKDAQANTARLEFENASLVQENKQLKGQVREMRATLERNNTGARNW